ncbi:MAG: hypothetical protein SFV15_15320 [Polyangiaceae bacterium]|nr:hypothetical protein [Polyangiaceae bacterium]
MRVGTLGMVVGLLASACVTDRTMPDAKHEGAAEYLCFEETSPEKVAARANAAAEKGWELVAAAGQPPIWCLHRSHRAP